MRSAVTPFLLFTLTGCILSSALAPPARAQGSGSSRTAQPKTRKPYAPPAQTEPSVPAPPTPEEFSRSLWTFLIRPKSPYTQWAPPAGKEGWRTVPGPHGPSARLYANAPALADPKGLPVGSILILEDYTADRKSRTGINIVYRVKGYDPKNGDWYWMKYLENGTLVRTPAAEGNLPLAGRVTACIDCHRKAGGNDFIFSNDPPARPEEMPKEKKPEGKKEDEARAPSAGPQTLLGRDWPASERVSIDTVDHRLWDALLKRHVDAKGRVDYAGWKGSPDDIRSLGSYLDTLARADAVRPAARDARLAYWINAYNALTVWSVLREYPADGVQDHAASETGDNPGRDLRLRVGGASFSLVQIENDVLRRLNEPRIHFAIVCGARGCPRLLNEGYKAAELEGQLTRNARAFFADRTKFDYDPTRNQVHLSAILDWYAEDFGKDTAERLRTIAPYLPEEAARRLTEGGGAKVSYQDYDRGLNERPAGHAGDDPQGGANNGRR